MADVGTTILLVRHADVHNPGDVLYGRLPRFGLSELGRRQAENTASLLAREPVSVFYSSPMLRARQTMRILAARHPYASVRFTRLLNEVRTEWQGRTHADLEKIRFNFYDNPAGPDDETLGDVWERVQRFVALVRRRHGDATVVGVTHGDVVILARAVYLRLPVEVASIRHPNVYPGKGSLTRLVFSADLRETYPLSVEYYDPNGEDPAWSRRWVRMEPHEGPASASSGLRDPYQ